MNDFVWHAIFLGELSTDFSVFAFDFVSDGFANIVEQSSGLGDAFISTNFFGDHTGHVGHFDRVKKHVLTVASTEFEFTE